MPAIPRWVRFRPAPCRSTEVTMNRRQWLSGLAALPLSVAAPRATRQPPRAPAPQSLELKDFQPKSMLKVPATVVPRARVPFRVAV